MLRELHISNLAVIEDVTIELSDRLNCFTGQTGAGKSLVIGAFEVLLGLRSAADLLRHGEAEGRVSGVFELTDPAVIEQINAATDGELDPAAPPQQLLVTRKLFASGRTSVSINGQPATLSMLQALGELLVDVHGQHDHQYLLKPLNQLLVLDRFGECEQTAEQFASLHQKWQQQLNRREELRASQALRQQQLDLYRFQADEIDQVEPTEGEYDEIAARYRVLSNLRKIQHDAAAASAALYESEGSIHERLAAAVAIVGELADLDETLAPVVDQLRDASTSLQDAAFTLGRYIHRLDLDESELEEVEQRLNALNRLMKKYGSYGTRAAGTLDDVLAYRAQLDQQLTSLQQQHNEGESIEQAIAELESRMQSVGAELTATRRAAAEKLRPLIETQLHELGMTEARFEVAIRPIDEHAVEHADHNVNAHGYDHVEMLVQTNPGQPARPLRKIASGGELSRIMLALKSILAQSDRISVLVFDEIDANIGGRMGSVVGTKLRDLAAHHQVLCITHLPQIAAFAHHHLRISKAIVEDQTHTRVEVLDDSRRVDELAEMLTGKNATATTRKQADEMITLAKNARDSQSAFEVEIPGRRRRAKSES